MGNSHLAGDCFANLHCTKRSAVQVSLAMTLRRSDCQSDLHNYGLIGSVCKLTEISELDECSAGSRIIRAGLLRVL